MDRAGPIACLRASQKKSRDGIAICSERSKRVDTREGPGRMDRRASFPRGDRAASASLKRPASAPRVERAPSMPREMARAFDGREQVALEDERVVMVGPPSRRGRSDRRAGKQSRRQRDRHCSYTCCRDRHRRPARLRQQPCPFETDPASRRVRFNVYGNTNERRDCSAPPLRPEFRRTRAQCASPHPFRRRLFSPCEICTSVRGLPLARYDATEWAHSSSCLLR